MDRCGQALEQAHPLPDPPTIHDSKIRELMDSIRRLDYSFHETETRYGVMAETLRTQELALRAFASNLCENLASLYENLGHAEKAKAVRMRAAAFQIS
jgi:leucyl-tRNA synthetase